MTFSSVNSFSRTLQMTDDDGLARSTNCMFCRKEFTATVINYHEMRCSKNVNHLSWVTQKVHCSCSISIVTSNDFIYSALLLQPKRKKSDAESESLRPHVIALIYFYFCTPCSSHACEYNFFIVYPHPYSHSSSHAHIHSPTHAHPHICIPLRKPLCFHQSHIKSLSACDKAILKPKMSGILCTLTDLKVKRTWKKGWIRRNFSPGPSRSPVTSSRLSIKLETVWNECGTVALLGYLFSVQLSTEPRLLS